MKKSFQVMLLSLIAAGGMALAQPSSDSSCCQPDAECCNPPSQCCPANK